MCNDFGNRIPYDDYLRAFSQTRIPVHWPKAASNLEPRDDIWPTDTAPVIRQTDVGHEFIQLRRGFPPATLKGSPIINFRSEKRRFPVGRCRHCIFSSSPARSRRRPSGNSKAGEPWFCFAGLWRPMPDGQGAGLHAMDDRTRPRRGADP